LIADSTRFANASRRSTQDGSDVRQASVWIANHAENVEPSADEEFDGRGDADQANHVLRLVLDQERRVDVEDEKRRTAEVVPATVVDVSAPDR